MKDHWSNGRKPKVSVCVPAYNHESYVETAIISIIKQTYQDFELLVIDDGSTDNTPDILVRLSKKHGFYFERQENMGLPKTLNKLITMTKGAFIVTLASDDCCPPERLSLQVAMLEANPEAAFVYGKTLQIDGNGRFKPNTSTFNDFTSMDDAAQLMLRRGMFFAAGSAMIRRTALDVVGPYDESLPFEDYDWFFRCTRKFPAIGLDEVTLHYRRHENNLSLAPRNRQKMLIGEKRMFQKHRGRSYYPVMVYHRIPIWFRYSIELRQRIRFFYACLFPFYLFHRKGGVSYFYLSLKTLLPHSIIERCRSFAKKAPLIR